MSSGRGTSVTANVHQPTIMAPVHLVREALSSLESLPRKRKTTKSPIPKDWYESLQAVKDYLEKLIRPSPSSPAASRQQLLVAFARVLPELRSPRLASILLSTLNFPPSSESAIIEDDPADSVATSTPEPAPSVSSDASASTSASGEPPAKRRKSHHSEAELGPGLTARSYKEALDRFETERSLTALGALSRRLTRGK